MSKQRLVFLPYKAKGTYRYERQTIQTRRTWAACFRYGSYWNGYVFIDGVEVKRCKCNNDDEARATLDKLITKLGHIIVDSEEEVDKYRLLL